MRAYIVLDLGFGDSGKGILTDFLVRHFYAGLVVRYNGGAQAGHNVIAPDGRHHTFSQFGSGSFVPGVKTFLSRHVVIHPAALLVEGEILEGIGVREVFSRLRLSDQALIVTPFHQAANRIRELVRGDYRHGSCGVGVGEAVEDALVSAEDSVRAGDLANPPVLRRKLRSIREEKRDQLHDLGVVKSPGVSFTREWEIFERKDVIDTWMSTISRIANLGLVVPDSVLQSWFQESETVVFEGAQGVLLDADSGFHPFTTWSRCTAGNAYDLIRAMAPDSDVYQIGVIRSYAVRHGAGPLPTETDALASIVLDHNKCNEWQGPVRYGWFDAVLARYALGATGGVDALAVTHLDVLSRLNTWKYCTGYQAQNGFDRSFVEYDASSGVISDFHLPSFLPLVQRAQFSHALATATPVLETCDADDGQVTRKIESLLGQPVEFICRGPTAQNVQITRQIPGSVDKSRCRCIGPRPER